MNNIYWDRDSISIITDQIDAVPHKHWAMQLFLSIDNDLNISVEEQEITCQCMVINRNVQHRFSTGSNLYFTMIIEPTSSLCEQLDNIIDEKKYHVFQTLDIAPLQTFLLPLVNRNETIDYQRFISKLYEILGIKRQSKLYDKRIKDLLYEIEHCNCDTHTIASFGTRVSLSPSRLSHLFKEQVGVPLKSYIQFHQMQKAFIAIQNGSSITEAAMIANFDTPSHFAATTKKMMGMPARISLKNSVFLKVTE